jgi:zinc protease
VLRVRAAALAALLAFASACAPQADRIASASTPRPQVDWAFEASDIPVDPGFRFGKLANGMRYVVRENATPDDTAIVRLEIAAGSLDESESELGYAHFVEHMAFNGSTNVPEGEMVRLLERHGLAFGADTNASTSFDRTTYKLDLPRNDPELLDIALMLMRETASELTIAQDAVERERGVILSERRDRNTWQLRNALADAEFTHPEARYPDRFPIGTAETIENASGASLRAFWQREYVPAQTTVIVIGDFDPALVEAAIRRHFESWQDAPAEPQPAAGPVLFDDGGRTDIYIDPAQSNRITASKHGPDLNEPDTVATREEGVLRRIGYSIVNRRLARLANQAAPPFRAAGYGTGDIFDAGRSTRLIVDVIEEKWQQGLDAAVEEYRRALKWGFGKGEVAEQVANIREAVVNAAGSADTRSHRVLEGAVNGLLRDDIVPSHPRTVLERFEAFAPSITPKKVLAAMKREAVPLDDPLLRYRGRNDIAGGAGALRAAWDAAMAERLLRGKEAGAAEFAYTDFGTPGTVSSDTVTPDLGIRTVRFANGVMLNLKRTEIERDRVLVEVNVDGGDRLATREHPLTTIMMRDFREGGLGKHSDDDLRTILAGRTVSSNARSDAETFAWNGRTTPADLELQLQLFAAYLTDPGYRREGQTKFRHYINNYFAQRFATPGSALGATLGGILSDDDPRFSLGEIEAYRALTFDKLRGDISERLANGAIEIAIVGDIDEEEAIAMVSRTFGALPPREEDFRGNEGQPPRVFTAERSQRIVHHTGPEDQAQARLIWPTRDASDPVETITLELLERIVRIELTETLREKLGKAYSPGASNASSRTWDGYGTFTIAASVDVAEVPATRTAIDQTIAALRDAPVAEDLVQRARQPMIEANANALKSNAGWMALVDRAQTDPEWIERYLKATARLEALTAADVQAMARRYLVPGEEVEVLVLPEGIEPPSAQSPPS